MLNDNDNDNDEDLSYEYIKAEDLEEVDPVFYRLLVHIWQYRTAKIAYWIMRPNVNLVVTLMEPNN